MYIRKQTPNDIVLTECGVPTLKERVRLKQQNFLKSKLTDPDEPLAIVYRLCEQNDLNAYRNLQKAIEFNSDSEKERHNIYTSSDHYVADYPITELTHFRVGSGEVERWSRYHESNGHVHVKSEEFRMKVMLSFI